MSELTYAQAAELAEAQHAYLSAAQHLRRVREKLRVPTPVRKRAPARPHGTSPYASAREKYLDYVVVNPDDPDGCWGWDGPFTSSGYPLLAYRGSQIAAHRHAWQHEHGPVPERRNLINPSGCRCANPAHYEVNVPKAATKPRRPQTAEEKFWRLVTKTDGCWEWSGLTRTYDGGPVLVFRGTYTAAQRFSWMLHRDPDLDHTQAVGWTGNCRCVNPDHLTVVPMSAIAAQRNARRYTTPRPAGGTP